MKKHGLPKSERLHGKKKIDEVFCHGKSGFVYPFRYLYNTSPVQSECDESNNYISTYSEKPQEGVHPVNTGKELPHPSTAILISVPKRYHKRAVARNLLKRRTREAYRLNKSILLGGGPELHIALIYSTKDILKYRTIENSVRKILSAIAENT